MPLGRRARLALGVLTLLLPLTANASPPPITNTVTVTAHVCSPGSVTPVIVSPPSGLVTASSTITVSGTAGTTETLLLKRNNIVAGSTTTDSFGQWGLNVTLLPGVNTLVASTCTDSAPVTVTYSPPAPPPRPPKPPTPVPGNNTIAGAVVGNEAETAVEVVTVGESAVPSPGSVPAGSFFLLSGAGILTIKQGETAEFPFRIVGGAFPVTIEAASGDGGRVSTDVNDRTLSIHHQFDRAGRFGLILLATDADGNRAVLETRVVVLPVDQGLPVQDQSLPTVLYILLLELLALAAVFVVWEYQLHRSRE